MADAQQSLHELLKKIADENNYENSDIKVMPFTSGGANYSSAIFYATISSPCKDDLNLFAKVAIIGKEFREKMGIDVMFLAEQLFYNDLVDIWKKIEEKYKLSEEHTFPFPKFYGGKSNYGEETVILENLVLRGYGMYSRFVSVDWEYAAKSIEELAKFHALSFVFEKDDPKKYSSISQPLKFEAPADEGSKQTWTNICNTAMQALSEENKAKVENYLKSNDALELYKKFCTPRGRPVITHGDYRPSNLMSKKEGDTYKIVPVDYQTLRTGCPVADIIYFVTLGSDEKFRAQYFDQLVDHYYQHLTLALKRFQMEIVEVYPRDEFDEDLKELLPNIIILALMVLQIVTVEAENAPKLEGDLGAFNIKTSDLFAERFTGLVNDCVRWGILS